MTDFFDTLLDSSITQVLLIALLASAASFIIQAVSGRLVRKLVRRKKGETKRDEEQREDTLISIIVTSLNVVVWLCAGLAILAVFGIDIGPLLAGAGLVGVALGFGAQTIVRDFLAGIFILVEKQYRVGDVLQVNQDVAGVVEHVSLRMTTLRDLDGKVHYIPNGEIQIATNLTMDYAQVDVNIGVGYESDLDHVEKVINDVGKKLFAEKEWDGVILEAPTMLRVDNFADSAIEVKVVCKTAPIRQWEVKSEILRRIKKAFDKEGITIPYPQRVIRNAEK